MIDDDISCSLQRECIAGPVLRHRAPNVAWTKAQMTQYDIVRPDRDLVPAKAYTVAGRRLAGYGQVGFVDREAAAQVDNAGDMEDNGARAVGFNGFTEATGTRIVQICNK